MAQVATKVARISEEERLTQKLIYTGEAAARVKPGMDRRTFKAWAKRAGVEVAYLAGDDALYHESDVEKVVRFYKEQTTKKPAKGGKK